MIFIIIPVHNRREYTHECLVSLRRQTIQAFRVVVVDDGSTDGSSEMIGTEFPEVTVLYGDGNLWWTRAMNVGVEHALSHQATYILTLNNDTVALDDFVEKMLYWADREPSSLLGALALDAQTGKPIYGGERVDWRTAGATSLLRTLSPAQQYGIHRVSHFPGRGLLIPSIVFHKIGSFDKDHFPHYGADYDFTHRAIRAGFEVFCNYDAKLLIYPDASGSVELRKRPSLQNYREHLWGMKGGGNLRVFFQYATRNCPKRYLPLFLLIGTLRRVLGYPLHWLVDGMKLDIWKTKLY